MTQETHWKPMWASLSWNYHCGSACPLSFAGFTHWNLLLWFASCGLQRWTVGVSHHSQLKVSISTLWLSVLYLVKILAFLPGFLGKQLVKLLFFVHLPCPLGFDCTLWLFPNLDRKVTKPQMRENPLYLFKINFMKMNGQLGNHGWGRAVCVSVFLVVCVFI